MALFRRVVSCQAVVAMAEPGAWSDGCSVAGAWAVSAALPSGPACNSPLMRVRGPWGQKAAMSIWLSWARAVCSGWGCQGRMLASMSACMGSDTGRLPCAPWPCRSCHRPWRISVRRKGQAFPRAPSGLGINLELDAQLRSGGGQGAVDPGLCLHGQRCRFGALAVEASSSEARAGACRSPCSSAWMAMGARACRRSLAW